MGRLVCRSGATRSKRCVVRLADIFSKDVKASKTGIVKNDISGTNRKGNLHGNG